MQDRDIPPEEEGRIDGVGADVRPGEEPEDRWAGIASSTKASTRHQWITAIAPTWAAIMAAEAARGAADLDRMPPQNPSHFQPIRMLPPESSPLSRTSFSSPRSRKPGAR